MGLTLGAAARATGKTKTTLARAIKTGKLSATRLDGGGYLIDPAELARVYPDTSSETVSTRPSEIGPEPGLETVTVRQLLAEKDLRLAEKDARIADLSATVDDLRRRLDTLTALLPDRRSWWRRWWRAP